MADAMAQLCYGFPLKKKKKKLQKAIDKYEEDNNYEDDGFIFNDCTIEEYGIDSNKHFVSIKTFENFDFSEAERVNVTDIVEIGRDPENYRKLMSFAEKFSIKIKPDDIGWYLTSSLF